MGRTFDRWLVGAGGLVALLVAAAVLTFQNTRRLDADAEEVAHTHEVIANLEELLSLAKDAETGQRGYLITGEDRYLEPYNAAVAAIGKQVDDVERLTADNPGQQARIPELRERIAAKLGELGRTIALRKDGDGEAARQEVLTGRGKEEMDALRAVVREMTGREEVLLGERSARRQQTCRTALLTGLLSGVAAVAGVLAFVGLLRRHLAARTAAAASIAEREERLSTTLASIGDGVLTTDTEGRVTVMNGVAESLTGWARGEAVGRPLDAVFQIVNEKSGLPAESPASRALREGVVVGLANHTVLIRKDGTRLPIDDSAAPIRDERGRVLGCVLVFRDVTRRREAEKRVHELLDRLKEGDRRKDEFLAMLAHELRGPLAPIRNMLEVLKRAGGNGELREKARGSMERQLAQLVRLVDDLVDVSRITRDRIELRTERVELAPVLQQSVEVCRPLAECAGHELTVTLPPQPVYLDADPVRLTQVFGNLLNNACKYTEPGGKVWLTAERRGDEVVVAVKDTGLGIPPDQLGRVFDIFTQSERTRERSQGGLGIGLTLVKRLVELHGGTVTAHSDGPGRGSEFVVRLPCVVDGGGQVVDGGTPSSPPTTRHPPPTRRVLVVDDNADAASSLAMLLNMAGDQTRIAHDGLEAVQAAERFRPDVVLLDLSLPKLNGYDVCRRIREKPWAGHVLIVALTGWGKEDDRRKSAEAGFDGHLLKPVDHDALMRLLADLAEANGRRRPEGGGYCGSQK